MAETGRSGERKPFQFDVTIRVSPDELDPDNATLRSTIATSLCAHNAVSKIEFDRVDGTTEVWESDDP